jgi:large repetitive protein
MIRRALRIAPVLVVAAGLLASEAAALRFDDSSYLVPTGMVGVPYVHRFTAPPPGTGGAGCDPPYIVSVDSGDLPPGLTLARGGEVTGTPTRAGSWSFWVSLKDDPVGKPWCSAGSTERVFTISIVGPLPGAEVGVPYGVQLPARGIGDVVAWAVSGALPPGLALTPTGMLKGTPTTSGSFAFGVSAIDRDARMSVLQAAVPVAPRLGIATLRLPAATKGRVYATRLTTRGGVGKVTCSLPPSGLGLRLDPVSGWLSGTPRRAGAFRLAVTCSDALRASAKASLRIAVALGPGSPRRGR